MKLRLLVAITVCAAAAHAQELPKVAAAQTSDPKAVTAQTAEKVKKPAFFDSQDPIEVTLTTNIGRLRHDKDSAPPWRAATLAYVGPDSQRVEVPVKVRTRGIYRLKMCDFPPLRFNFSSEATKGTIFRKLDKPKLVSYCRDIDGYEEYILQEFQLYRIYQLLTPVSHRARLLKVTYTDSARKKMHAKRYAFLIEEPAAMAERLGGKVMEQKGALPGDLDPYQDALMGVFQYMIGNTDFSTSALHNVELFFGENGLVMPVAYDFDFAGAVNTQYAGPDEKLRIKTVRERLFRGYCAGAEDYAKVFALFNEKKDAIYALYSDSIGKLMDRGDARQTLRYFDGFYETINNPRAARRSIVEECIKRP